ncbi:hypothetical protein FGIG_12661 [Fasciola gigantica]|uniref:Uncharacterized protein n=1 Tax=Fasciola gigantica TaxID=46835 RepID=A0A504Y8F9_FASGI|nr:hypothetical protein FGIG_12661 [Fasciola gigantica]
MNAVESILLITRLHIHPVVGGRSILLRFFPFKWQSGSTESTSDGFNDGVLRSITEKSRPQFHWTHTINWRTSPVYHFSAGFVRF